MTKARSASSWSAMRRAASGGRDRRVTAAASETTRRNRAASRSAKMPPHVKVGISRIATVSGKSTAEFVS